jgi:diacylglycerol kinase family enzyme
VNPRSGDEGTEELLEAARERGIETHVLAEGDDLEALARDADGDVLGMAGGDGSLGPVAWACVERGLPFVCVPFGTRNHFARDVGLDRDDPVAALDAFGPDAEERHVDVGRLGERLFLNNVSLGVYAGLVHERERRRRRREAFARLKALGLLARTRHRATILLDGAPVDAPLVLVANNSYTHAGRFTLGERERLDEGRLHLYVVTGAAWEERAAERFELDAHDGTLRAAVDGEPAQLETPLELAVEPLALRVRLPRGTNAP